jgi:hypothetical protein
MTVLPAPLRAPLRAFRARARHWAMLWGARGLARRHAPPAAPALPLALVVPVWNDRAGLMRLLAQAGPLGLFAEVVVVDDGSDPPLPPPGDWPALPGAALRLIRHDRPLGGGVARNAGQAAVTAPWMMYLDADDLIAPDLPPLLADLAAHVAAGGRFDLCLFKHADSRVAAEGRWGQPAWDEDLWTRAGHAVGALVPAEPAVRPILAQIVNYPWNKVYRTAFLRDRGIACAATAVHQDIALHWGALIAAEGMLVSDRIGVWHGVDMAPADPGRARLTARRGAERLQLFAALDPVVPLAAAAGPAWQAALAAFALTTADWAETRIDPALVPAFRAARDGWLAARLVPWAAVIAGRDPALARRLQPPPPDPAPDATRAP